MLFLLACATWTPDLTPYTGSEAACLAAHCGQAESEDAFTSCRAQSCAYTDDTWQVSPTLLRYDGNVVTMSVQVEHTEASYGDTPVPHEGDTWLGATVLTATGGEIDMAVHTVFPDRLGEPFTFSSEVGPDVTIPIIGLWGKKIEPCDSTRSGCQMFGFLLDQSLGAWPPLTYVESPPHRQRFLPPTLTVQTRTVAATSPVLSALPPALGVQESRFGTRFEVTAGAEAAPTASEIIHRYANDQPVATELAEALGAAAGFKVAVRADPAAEADLVVSLGCATGPECR